MWGPRPGGDQAVSLSQVVSASWDDQIPIKPSHDVRQRHVGQYRAPEIRCIDAPPFRKAAAQREHERVAASTEPISPAPHGVPVKV